MVLCGLTNVTLLAQLWSAILLVFEATLSYQDVSSVNAFLKKVAINETTNTIVSVKLLPSSFSY